MQPLDDEQLDGLLVYWGRRELPDAILRRGEEIVVARETAHVLESAVKIG